MYSICSARAICFFILGCSWFSGGRVAESARTAISLKAVTDAPARHHNRRLLDVPAGAKGVNEKSASSSQSSKPTPTSQQASQSKRPKPKPATSIEVCSGMTLSSPLDNSGKPVYTFGNPVACDDVAAFMSETWAAAAAARGARLASPFALRSCSGQPDTSVSPPSPPSIVVCGSFASKSKAATLQGDLVHMMSTWKRYVLGLPLPDPAQPHSDTWCPPPGYDIASFVWSDGEDAPLLAYVKVGCSESLLADVPPEVEEEGDACGASATPADTPLSLSNVYVNTVPGTSNGSLGAGDRSLCTRVAPRDSCNASSCCQMAAAKVKLMVSDACLSGVSRVTVDGLATAATWQGNALVTAVPDGLLSSPAGAEVCWHVPSAGPCSLPRSFCDQGQCQVDVVSSDGECCQRAVL